MSDLRAEDAELTSSSNGRTKGRPIPSPISAKKTLWREIREHPEAPAFVLGIALAAGVCFPLVLGGRLFLLDLVLGPHSSVQSGSFVALNGGLTAGLPFNLAVSELAYLIGSPSTPLVMALFFPIATVGASRFVGGSVWGRLAAATLYGVNPFVFDRLFVGHLGLLLGYALLPLATRSAINSVPSRGAAKLTLALWWAVLTALSPHFAWIYGAVLAAVWFTHHPFHWAKLRQGVAICVLFAVLGAYLALPHAATQLQVSTRTSSDLALYRTSGDPRLGLFGNVLGLYGFWRLGPELPKDTFAGWPFLLLAILVVAGLGAVQRLRPRPRTNVGGGSGHVFGRRGAAAVLVAGIGGYFLALGDQGPTGSLFRWAYFHVPFFAVMREPEKFLMLTALAYAVFFGWGVNYLVRGGRSLRFQWRTASAAGIALVLPLTYTATIFDGLAGQLRPGQLPVSWATADRIMGNGPGQVLFLPWHLYLAFPFTAGRVVASPAPTSFRRSVISGDNLEAGGVESTSTSPRSAYLQRLYAEGPGLSNFGRLVAPLGVKYVVLAETVDWRSYYWLKLQTDLIPVLNSGGLEIWRNAAYTGVGYGTQPRLVRQISPVAYSIGRGPPGVVTLDAVFQKGWQLGTQKAQETPQGTIRFHVGSRGGIVQFTPWGITRLGYIVSGSTFVALLGVVIGDRLWRGGRNQRQAAPRTGLRGANPSCPG